MASPVLPRKSVSGTFLVRHTSSNRARAGPSGNGERAKSKLFLLYILHHLLCERLVSSYTPQSRHTSLLDMGRAYKHRLEANLTEFDAYTAVPLCERCRVWGTGTQPHTVYARAARMSATTDGPTRQSPHPAHPRKHTKHESWVQSARERVRQGVRVAAGLTRPNRPHRGARVGSTVASRSSCCVMPPVARALPLADIHRPIPALPTASSALIMVREVGRLVDAIINDGGGVGEKVAVDDGTIEPCVRSGLERSAGLAVGAQSQGNERRAQKMRQGW